jgi:hypothetical protein
MKISLLLSTLFLLPMTFSSASALTADTLAMNEDPANGNLISEPALTDYVAATRAPAVLSSAYDIEE